MNKKDHLQEQYEDALFSLLMERVAESCGEQAYAENEALKADPTFDVPADLEKRCMKLIRKKAAKQSKSEGPRAIKMTLYRAAAVACIALILFATAFAASPKLQTNAINFLIREFDGYATFSFVDQISVSSAPKVTVSWLPSGFSLAAQEQNSSHTVLTYQNDGSAFIRIFVSDERGSVTIDTEQANVSPVTINDYSAIYCDDGMMKSIIWGIDSLSIYVMVTSVGIAENELFEIASEIHVAR